MASGGRVAKAEVPGKGASGRSVVGHLAASGSAARQAHAESSRRLPQEKAKPIGRFTARDRVRKRSEYQRIQASRFRVITSSFIFLLEHTPQAERPRVGITASRRVGNAVQRNRAKRLVREAFRVLRGFWPKQASVVVIVRAGVGDRSLDDVVSEWRAAQPRIERAWARLTDGAGATDPLHGKNSC